MFGVSERMLFSNHVLLKTSTYNHFINMKLENPSTEIINYLHIIHKKLISMHIAYLLLTLTKNTHQFIKNILFLMHVKNDV